MITLEINEESTSSIRLADGGQIVVASPIVVNGGEVTTRTVSGKIFSAPASGGTVSGVDFTIVPKEDESAVTWQNLSPSVASFDEETLQSTRLANGLSIIVATRGPDSQRVSVNMTSGISEIEKFVGFAESSLAESLAADVYAMLDGAADINLYSTFSHETSTYIRNTACWTYGGPDFSGSPIATKLKSSAWSHENRGALITPQHCEGKSHWNMNWPQAGKGYTIGGKLLFQGRSGTLYERTIVGVAVTGSDVAICTLDEALPESDVKVYSLVDDWFVLSATPNANLNGGVYTNFIIGGLAIDINQNLNAVVRLINASPDASSSPWNLPKQATLSTPGQAGIDSTFWPSGVEAQHAGQQLADGDSGSPTFAYKGGETFYFGSNGDFLAIRENGVHVYADLIATADAQAVAAGRLSAPTGYAFRFAADPLA